MRRQYYVTALVLVAVALAAFSADPVEYYNFKSLFFRTEAGAVEAVGPSAPLPVTEGQWSKADTDWNITVSTSAAATFGADIGVPAAGSRIRLQATGTIYFSNEGKAVASMSSLSYLRADVPEYFVWESGDTMQFVAATGTVLRVRIKNQ